MKGLPLFRRAAIVLACVLGMTAAGSGPAFAGGQTAYELTGRVTNQSGSPLEGSIVEVFNAGTATLVGSAPTGADGKYTIALFAGTYDVRVTPAASTGFGIATAPNRVISSNSTLDFVLVPSGVSILSGRVLDASGHPLSDVVLYLTPAGGTHLPTVTTDPGGNYSFSVSPGEYHLYMQAYTAASSAASGHFSWGTTSPLTLTDSLVLDLKLPFKRVDVHVQTSNGQPVANVGLTTQGMYSPMTMGPLTGYGYSYYFSWDVPRMTDAAGNATLWLFPTHDPPHWGLYTLTATPPAGLGLATTNAQNVTVHGDTAVTITLATPATLSGRILDALGNPLSDVLLYLTPSGGTHLPTVTTDATGSYAFDVAPGEYHLYMQAYTAASSAASGHFSWGTTSPLTLTESLVLDLKLPFKRVNVHVEDLAGQAVPNVTFTTQGMYSPMTMGPLTGYGYSYYFSWDVPRMTDAAGNATLWLFPTHDPPHWGLYTITAAPPDGSPFAIFNVQNVTVNGDKELFVVLQFAHEPPVTTIAVSPQATNGLYPDPVTVTLSALAAQGYTVQSTQFSIDGGAAQMYSGPFTVSGGGQHTIQYWSVDNTGVFDLAKTLTIQLAQAGGKVTGGGTVENNGVRATFGFTAKSGEPGSLTYVEHRKGATVQLKAAEISSVSVNGNTAVITGGATLNGSSGYSFRLTAVDNGEPGRSDSFGLEVRDADGAIVAGLTFGPVTLSGGNIQIHK